MPARVLPSLMVLLLLWGVADDFWVAAATGCPLGSPVNAEDDEFLPGVHAPSQHLPAAQLPSVPSPGSATERTPSALLSCPCPPVSFLPPGLAALYLLMSLQR